MYMYMHGNVGIISPYNNYKYFVLGADLHLSTLFTGA